MTGDIGEFHVDGSISIIDRKKNLVKLSNGEYIALEKLEAVYKTCTLCQNVCVYADPEYGFAVAVVCASLSDLSEFAREKGLIKEDHLEMCDLIEFKECKEEVFKMMIETGRKAGFRGSELLGGIILSPEEWTSQNNYLV